MTGRITNENIANALKHYSNALNAVGFDHDPEQLRVEAPYGQVWYVLRRDDEGRIHHDLPGFTGSGSSGFINRRDLYITLLHIASAFFDLDYHRCKTGVTDVSRSVGVR